MPLFEYRCRECGERFEEFVVENVSVACRRCGSEEVQKLLSAFAVGNSRTRARETREAGGCGSCGDPRGPGACEMD